MRVGLWFKKLKPKTRTLPNKAHTLGLIGEEKAAAYLKKKGFKILARRYKASFGEIDLVGQLNAEIIFVEVKTRRNPMLDAVWAVNLQKQKKIRRLAELYILEHNIKDLQPRFDVICVTVTVGADNFQIEHLENSF